MLTVLLIALLAGIMLIAISLYKAYHSVVPKELKRRAQKGDDVAKALYRAVAYGPSLRALLWIIIGLSAGGFFVLLARSFPAWAALAGSIALLWIGFAWLPNSRMTIVSEYIARFLTPIVAWLLRIIHPVADRFKLWFNRSGHVTLHTGLYQKDDVLELLDKQKTQLDNRITDDELRIARGALTFSGKLVRAVMIPRRAVKMIAATDTIGPIVMAELHDSGHSRFPVYESKPDNIVGTLYLRDIIDAKAGGQVKTYMGKSVYYVKEDKPLGHVLQAFLRTKHQLFMVVNNFEEIVGIITIEDILEQIIGKPILDEFDKYEDLRAVAALDAKTDHKNHTEVVE